MSFGLRLQVRFRESVGVYWAASSRPTHPTNIVAFGTYGVAKIRNPEISAARKDTEPTIVLQCVAPVFGS